MTAIQDKHQFLRQNVVDLGEPLAAEVALPDGGSKQQFEFGRIYFHPRVGAAFEVHGAILDNYVALGEQNSPLGYPKSDELDDPDGKVNFFEGGSLQFNPATGVNLSFTAQEDRLNRIVVKIVDRLAVPIAVSQTLTLDELGVIVGLFPGDAPLEVIRGVSPNLVFGRHFDPVEPATIDQLIAKAVADDPEYRPPSFNNFLSITLPNQIEPEPLVDLLGQLVGIVEAAYVLPVPVVAGVVGTSNPNFQFQRYLSSISGIGVQAAWATGADGTGTKLIDIENGWFLKHQDIPQTIALLEGFNGNENATHGTAVLGIIAGIDDDKGIVGIAPAVDIALISDLSAPGTGSGATASKILQAAVLLSAGDDVLLLELNHPGGVNGLTTLLPMESTLDNFHAILLATKAGIIVVEPAGNGGTDLDSFLSLAGTKVLARHVPGEFQDSGAIMVGACTSDSPPKRAGFSNFGSRVDCCALGENVHVAGNNARPFAPDAYNSVFGGTSSASAIVAGVCLLIQDMQQRLTPRSGIGRKLKPLEIRNMLRNGANCTQLTAPQEIGNMPDFVKLVPNEYN